MLVAERRRLRGSGLAQSSWSRAQLEHCPRGSADAMQRTSRRRQGTEGKSRSVLVSQRTQRELGAVRLSGKVTLPFCLSFLGFVSDSQS